MLERDPAYAVAVKACKAAMAGMIDAETARSIFVAFAERHELLAPEVSMAVIGRSRRRSDPHLR